MNYESDGLVSLRTVSIGVRLFLETSTRLCTVLVQFMSDPTLSTLSSASLQSLLAFVQFTNLDGCSSPSTMPDEVKYTLRMQE